MTNATKLQKSGWIIGLLWLTLALSDVHCWGSKDPGKVLLRDIQVLTLRNGKMTTGKRSSPVPQLKCVGGSAQGAFNPQVVQCYNRGWDGVDVQWECKADMDNLYRFGEIEVVCEGYDYPDDAYITKGSCGLEYTLEYTQEGRAKRKDSSSGWFGSDSHSSSWHHDRTRSELNGKWKGIGDLVTLGGIAFAMYAIYKCCLAPSLGHNVGDRQYSSTDGDYPTGGPGGGSGGGGGWFNPGGQNQNQHHQGGGFNDGSCGGGGDTYTRAPGTGGTGGFWSGMATGGLLGYLFGGSGYNRTNYNNYGGYWGGRRGYGTGNWGGTGGGSWFGGGGGGRTYTSSSSPSSSSSSGTRTASGFGGTRRR